MWGVAGSGVLSAQPNLAERLRQRADQDDDRQSVVRAAVARMAWAMERSCQPGQPRPPDDDTQRGDLPMITSSAPQGGTNDRGSSTGPLVVAALLLVVALLCTGLPIAGRISPWWMLGGPALLLLLLGASCAGESTSKN